MQDIIKLVFATAAKSNIDKRQVGCVIVDASLKIVGTGFNVQGQHAEKMAINDFTITRQDNPYHEPLTFYVSHTPCKDCALTIGMLPYEIEDIIVVEEFMKFDGDKTRYDLVPPSAIKALADVITFGARKYKPNNWRECKDLSRYEGALLRHIQAWREGEKLDKETGFHHLAHAMTNLAFILELENNE